MQCNAILYHTKVGVEKCYFGDFLKVGKRRQREDDGILFSVDSDFFLFHSSFVLLITHDIARGRPIP